MKRLVLKKVVSCIAAVSVLCTIFLTGCTSDKQNGENNAADNQSTAQTEVLAENTMPIVSSGSVTLRIGGRDNAYAPASYTQNLPIFQEIEKKTGVKIEWDVIPTAQFATNMQTRLAAAESLPDIITAPSNDTPVRYGADGLLIKLNDLIDKSAPNIRKMFSEYPEVRKYVTAPDGNIYSLTSVVLASNTYNYYTLLMRQDWLDKVDLKVPTNTDELYKVLKAFKEGNVNNSGKSDVIPFVASNKLRDLTYFGNAWGLHFFRSSGFWAGSDGKVTYEWLDPRAKDMVTWLNKLYKEGLIDPEFSVKNASQATSMITKNQAGSMLQFVTNLFSWEGGLKASGVEDAKFAAVGTLQGPNGYKGHIEKYGPVSGHYCITKFCKNPEVAIRWLDYVYATKEGKVLTNYGIEGKSYTMQNGKPTLNDWAMKNPDNLGPLEALRSLGAIPSCVPYFVDLDMYSYMLGSRTDLKELGEKLEPYHVDPFPAVLATEEENSKIASVQTDIDTFVEESVTKFVMGQESINNWDKFTSQIKSMGIEDVLKVKQQQYERYQKN